MSTTVREISRVMVNRTEESPGCVSWRLLLGKSELSAARLKIGDSVKVTCEPGKITIERFEEAPHAASAQ